MAMLRFDTTNGATQPPPTDEAPLGAAPPSATIRAAVPEAGVEPLMAEPQVTVPAVVTHANDLLPMTAPPGSVRTAVPQSREAQKLDQLRRLQASLLDLQSFLAGASGSETLHMNAPYIGKAKTALAAIDGIDDGDTIQHLRDLWYQMQLNPLLSNPESVTGDQLLQFKDSLLAQLDQAAFYLATLTIPERVNSWLAQMRPGYVLPFHDLFADELPNLEARTRLLNYLAHAPKRVEDGLVDVEAGLIYRYAHDWRSRLGTISYLITIFALFTGILVGIAFLNLEPPTNVNLDWPTMGNLDQMLIAWGALLVGIFAHIVVQIKKQPDAGRAELALISTGDLPLLVSAHGGQIVLKLALALIALLALIFTMGVPGVTIITAFLAGYSLDSVIDLFGAAADTGAAAQREGLSRQLGIKETH